MDRYQALPVLVQLAARARLDGRRTDEDAITAAIDILWMGLPHPMDAERQCRAVLLEKHVRRVAREMIADDVRSWREAPIELLN